MPIDVHRRGRIPRGMSLVEVLISLVILAIALLGLTAGIIVAFTATGRASRRTQMAEFAQSSLERLIAASRKNVCTGSFNGGVVDCARMGTGTFDATAAPNAGGWMMDVLDRADALVTANGVDLMAGPVVVLGNTGGAIDETATVTARTAVLTDWAGGGAGCASTLVTNNMLCREIHIEAQDAKVTGTTALNVYHVWVRVVRGGGGWRDGLVQLEGVIAQ